MTRRGRERAPPILHARSAVERAKSANRFTPSVAVDSDNADAAASAESLLRVLGFIISGRTDAQWEAIEAHRAGESVSDIADRLGISVEAVSQRRGYGAQSIEEAAWPTLDAPPGRSTIPPPRCDTAST